MVENSERRDDAKFCCDQKSREPLWMAGTFFFLALSVALAAALGSKAVCAKQASVDVCTSFPCPDSCDKTLKPCNGLIFEELWNQLNLDTWEHEITAGGGGDWEFQHYTNNRSNSYVRDGTLFIRPTLTEETYNEDFVRTGTLNIWGSTPADTCTDNAFYGCERSGKVGSFVVNPVQSARLRTVHSFAFTYGCVEVTAKMPTGDWLWPAIWLMPKRNAYGNWPSSGLINIVESRGNVYLKDAQGVSHGVDEMGSILHWGPYPDLNSWWRTYVTKHATQGTFGTGFHKYGMEWTPDYIRFLLDGQEILKVDPGAGGFWEFGKFPAYLDNPWKGRGKMAPFDLEFYLILNLAVGGTVNFFDEWTNRPHAKPWNNTSPTAMLDFYNAKYVALAGITRVSRGSQWLPTWKREVSNGEEAALQVKDIRVWAYK
ncbi:beta-1,3-glucan-binding protein-like isoform X1 [Lethenteron reissneri]|uniref:beta-1,3-glucan-binding protein-like isoform X1 n=1 Tax=Lethenteron reissneri TaxID=7753 RepID=UPI002AB62E58|nr:beta-1,3-glucan-binding protein-like isoform X1 [Lethenteron reissneri]XP_061407479.1 beta-1,3-glucan-binding protein-like isoform X1 [Lethenteron reissneri]